MKISVLLPTRDRLELLRHAVASVQRLQDKDWEIVISDNHSSGDVEGYVASLNDKRVRYVRTPRLLSITENWNNALVHSTGEYIIMLGDDDALLSGYFMRTRRLIAAFDRPQVIYHNALGFAYPGVMPAAPDGLLRSEGYARFLRGAKQPFRLSSRRARTLARKAADFRFCYGFNMQFVTISRSLVTELSGDGDFFRSPFPDYYTMNHIFARAHSIVAEPHPLVVIGISPRSYGFFFYNGRETEGRAFLEGKEAPAEQAPGQARLLPGMHINNGWLRAVEDLYRKLGCPADFKPNYRRYRMLQILHVYNEHHLRGAVAAEQPAADEQPAPDEQSAAEEKLTANEQPATEEKPTTDEQLAELKLHMTMRERLIYGSLFAALSLITRVLPPRVRPQMARVATLIARQLPWWNPVPDPGYYRDITEVVAGVNGYEDPTRWAIQQDPWLIGKILTRIFP